MPDKAPYVNGRSILRRRAAADTRTMIENALARQSRIDALEELADPLDALAPYRLPDGSIDVDALELGQPADVNGYLERPAPFTTVREGRRYVPRTVLDARRRAAEAAERNPPPVPGIDRCRLRAALELDDEHHAAHRGRGDRAAAIAVLVALAAAVVTAVILARFLGA